ncbi:lasso peptide biosynthesis PqqD family chaperone [Paenibacillus sp. LMG 31461]|uniref:Lasso peptide biosynthesis PqqD family chaperone n=1 Tax=Paenibacillus plantarum TaxID=2654975 RepID=A0ABX1X9W3_9BACL|nr:lasso peptide biosynthesis PqqD family chaperone [Paenibacillus plantarum]NOU65171.1 lasso peptide biosynthesis PqqD family chaperone [Paenibacillus plantarum]
MISNQTIEMTQKVVQKDGHIVSDMGGEKVMLSIENGKYYNLGSMGGIIWDMIQEPMHVEHLINKLMEEYDVERSVCEGHVVSFLEHMAKEGLILRIETGDVR